MITTSQEAARELGMSPANLHKHIARGNVSIQRAGRIVLVDTVKARKELEAHGYSWSSRPRKARINKAAQAAS